jgi:hypothetical protein
MTWFRFNGFFSVPVARNTPARRGDTITTHPTAQEAQAAETVALSFDGPLLIVGGGAVDIALLREIARGFGATLPDRLTVEPERERVQPALPASRPERSRRGPVF